MDYSDLIPFLVLSEVAHLSLCIVILLVLDKVLSFFDFLHKNNFFEDKK